MPIDSIVPSKPITSGALAWKEWSEVPRIGVRYRHLSRTAAGDNYHVGVAIEELDHGKQSAPAHYHIFEEEHVFILEGSLTVRIGAHAYEIKAGDYVCFPAGQKAGHCLVNHGGSVCRYVIVGERHPNDVVVYTDSNKVLVRTPGERAIFDLTAKRGYWDGEDTGLTRDEAPPKDPEAPASEKPDEPIPPISSKNVAWEFMLEGTRFGGHSRRLTYAAAGTNYRVGLRIEAPEPGMRLAPVHYHMLEEEHALILEGQVTLLLGEGRYEMKAGDYVYFPAGLKVGHSFMNSGSGPCSYLMIGERNPNDICVYPESNKMAINGLRRHDAIFDMSALRTYWEGEQTL